MNEKTQKTITTIFAPLIVFKDEWCALLLGMLVGSIVLFISCYTLKLSHTDDAIPIISPTINVPDSILIHTKPESNEESITFDEPIPAWSNYVSSDFGEREDPTEGGEEFHHGIDIAAAGGTPIHAAADGIATTSEVSDTGYGNHIILTHSDSLSTIYGHCTTLLVTVGQNVKRGDIIATVGSTGDSTGPHLHFEVVQNNTSVNPKAFLL